MMPIFGTQQVREKILLQGRNDVTLETTLNQAEIALKSQQRHFACWRSKKKINGH